MELTQCIERAILFFDYHGTDSSPRRAVDALRQTTWVLDISLHTSIFPIYLELHEATEVTRYSERKNAVDAPGVRQEEIPVSVGGRVRGYNR